MFVTSRICPGRHLSNGSLFMLIASVLHTYNIQPILGEDGKKYDPFAAVITGLISYVISRPLTIPQFWFLTIDTRAPEDVPCTVTPRSQEAEALINQSS